MMQEIVQEHSTSFVIDNVDEVATESGTREKVKVPQGTYDVQVQLIRPNVYPDKKGFKQQMLHLKYWMVSTRVSGSSFISGLTTRTPSMVRSAME